MVEVAVIWGVVGLALALALFGAALLMRGAVRVDLASNSVLKMIGKLDFDRAHKLCRAAPQSPFLQAVDGALTEAAVGSPEDGESILRERVGERYRRALDGAMGTLRRGHQAAWLALVSGVAAVVVGRLGPEPVPMGLFAVSWVPVLLALWTIRSYRTQVRAQEASGPRVVAAVVAARMMNAGDAAALARARASSEMGDLTPPPKAAPPAEKAAAVPPPAPASYAELELRVSIDGKPCGVRPLDAPIIKIGRILSSHVAIQHESVSRMHAVVETEDGESTIIDLGSERGTFVNGTRVNKAVIGFGDEIRIGDAILVVARPGAPADAPPEEPAVPALLDLRRGVCAVCRGHEIEARAPSGDGLVPWVCRSCGYTQLFAV